MMLAHVRWLWRLGWFEWLLALDYFQDSAAEAHICSCAVELLRALDSFQDSAAEAHICLCAVELLRLLDLGKEVLATFGFRFGFLGGRTGSCLVGLLGCCCFFLPGCCTQFTLGLVGCIMCFFSSPLGC